MLVLVLEYLYTCILETFVEDGDEIFLELPRGYSYVPCAAIRSADINAVRASGGFGILFNCSKVRIVPGEFQNVANGIFHGPVHLLDGTTVHVISVYRTKNAGSSVYDKNFFDHLEEILSSLQGMPMILGGDFNAKLGDWLGALGLVITMQNTFYRRNHLVPRLMTPAHNSSRF
jgi:hypothetical protein